MNEVEHPGHYGGVENVYETIKVLAAWGLLESFAIGNAVKYLSRAGKKGDALTDLRKAAWYLAYEIERREAGHADVRQECELSGALAWSLRADVERLTAENDCLRWQLKHMQRLAVP